MRKLLYIFVLIIPMFCITCCTPKSTVEQNQLTHQEMEELLIQQNRQKLEAERAVIKAYVDSSDYEFTSSGSGLLYSAAKLSSDSIAIKEGDLLELEYVISSIHGVVLESSETEGTKQVRYLRDDEIMGLHEGLAIMHLEDEYIFVIPAHLGFGLSGDLNIPSNSTLVYQVKIVSINK